MHVSLDVVTMLIIRIFGGKLLHNGTGYKCYPVNKVYREEIGTYMYYH